MIDLLDITAIAPPFGFGLASETPAADFLTALRARLLSLDALDDLADVYLTASPAGAEFPFLVVNVVGENPFINTTESFYEEVECQFDCFAEAAEAAEVLGKAARRALLPKADNPPLLFEGGYEMTRLPGRAVGPYRESWGMPGGDAVWRYRFDVTFLIGRN